MSVRLHLTEEIKAGCTETFLQAIARKTLGAPVFDFLASKSVSLGVSAVSEERIQSLNREYRGKNAPTDILSFGEYATLEELSQEAGGDIELGELFFAPGFIGRAAQEDGVTYERELAYIFSHGVLHLLGLDHGEVMFALQDEVTEHFENQKKGQSKQIYETGRKKHS